MKHCLLLSLLLGVAVACNRKPATEDSNKPRPGETIEARLFLPKFWSHGKSGELSVVYEIHRAGKPEPIQLQASDLPAEFLPELIINFESDGKLIGNPLRLSFNADC